jgi:hypothetical protein
VGGCTAESVRVAIESQRRADEVQRAVVERQAEALRILLYRDLVARLELGGAALTPAQKAAINEVWNERDLIEFWGVQFERATALRLIGVDAELFASQSTIDLLLKRIGVTLQRAKEGAAAAAGASLDAPKPTPPPPGGG